jgi:netrin-G3 ligand
VNHTSIKGYRFITYSRILTLELFIFPDPPRITHAPAGQKVVNEGIVSFFCKAAGNPAPDIYWRRNGRRIGSNRNRFLIVDMPHGSVLRIEPVRANRDSSDFQCVADNGIGEPATADANLEVYPEGESK